MSSATKQKILNSKDFLSYDGVSTDQVLELLQLATEIKTKLKNGEAYAPLSGKTLAMIFEKSSTRTRVSFEVGMLQLGGHALFLSNKDLQIGRGETIGDTAQVLSEYVDGIMIRTFEHEKVEELAKFAAIPVINGLTDLSHPCQALADLLTIQEIKGTLKGLKMSYVGDGNNVAHSLMIACAKVGMNFAIAAPTGYEANSEIIAEAKKIAEETGCTIEVTTNPQLAVKNADVIYGDVWTSMGQEAENQKRLADFTGYQVNAELVKGAKSDYIYMHCLPAHREEEVSAEIIDGPNSVVFHQAGNRMHAQKALLVDLMS
ncbi:ornithine carbamoyltransferase [Bacillus massiliigorillae]|uniref:ornithine carbamoyltransferase n=1 Tax=Bacillus massiliigorillae TaxID=1243664 RepID=UPI00039E5F6C|nr:ornithine carbamoyltransferase [Bacillus massiliigorillae]